MTLRADHVAGSAFVVFGIAIIALPFVIVTTVLLGLLLVGTRLPKRIKR